MLSTIKNFFETEKQFRLFLLLCLTTLLDFALVAYRMHHTGFDIFQWQSVQDIANTRSFTFMFLVWNLFLAWIPYLIAISLEKLPQRWWVILPALGAWLVFLPNAPYIVTDLLHVNYRPPVPLWFDVMLIFSFAWTGLLLCFLSILEVQRFLEKRLSKKVVIPIIWAVIGLCAFGVYVGRYQRWNSWDLLTHPYQLFMEMAAVLYHPMQYLSTLGLAVVMAGVLGVGYLTLQTLVAEK